MGASGCYVPLGRLACRLEAIPESRTRYETQNRRTRPLEPDEEHECILVDTASRIQVDRSGCQQSHEDGETKNTLPSRACINGA